MSIAYLKAMSEACYKRLCAGSGFNVFRRRPRSRSLRRIYPRSGRPLGGERPSARSARRHRRHDHPAPRAERRLGPSKSRSSWTLGSNCRSSYLGSLASAECHANRNSLIGALQRGTEIRWSFAGKVQRLEESRLYMCVDKSGPLTLRSARMATVPTSEVPSRRRGARGSLTSIQGARCIAALVRSRDDDPRSAADGGASTASRRTEADRRPPAAACLPWPRDARGGS